MKFDFPIKVSNRYAFLELMKAIEKEHPEVKWSMGEKPTEYLPPNKSFPIRIELGVWRNNCLTYERWY